MHLVRLEMVQDAFLAPCLGQKMLQKRKFGVKWLRDLTTGDANPTTRDATLYAPEGAPWGWVGVPRGEVP